MPCKARRDDLSFSARESTSFDVLSLAEKERLICSAPSAEGGEAQITEQAESESSLSSEAAKVAPASTSASPKYSTQCQKPQAFVARGSIVQIPFQPKPQF